MAGELRGWHPDPFNAHERRYFSLDGKPTRLVSDNGRTSHDPPLPVPLSSAIGSTPTTRSQYDQRQSPPSVPPSGANVTMAPGSITFPPLAAKGEWERDRPPIGPIYQSVGGDEQRTELNSTAPVFGPLHGDGSAAPTPALLDRFFPNASPERRASLQRFVRYGSVSLISTTVGLAVLGFLIGVIGYPAIWSNVIATAIGTVPSFELNRRWVWAQNGERSISRQAVPYFLLSFAGLVVSTFAVHLASDATIHSSRLVHTAAAELANVAAYGSLWLIQFVLCDRILFRAKGQDSPLSDAQGASELKGATNEAVAVGALADG